MFARIRLKMLLHKYFAQTFVDRDSIDETRTQLALEPESESTGAKPFVNQIKTIF